jgi:hypothetical protein
LPSKNRQGRSVAKDAGASAAHWPRRHRPEQHKKALLHHCDIGGTLFPLRRNRKTRKTLISHTRVLLEV